MIARNNIEDISPLEDLTQLEFFDLSCNPITDISSLHSLTSLTHLYLTDCSVKDLSPVYGLSSLEALYVSDNGISEINGVSKLKKLREIDVTANGLVDVSFIGELKKLEIICLSDNHIKNLNFLRSHTQNRITRLEIGSNPIKDTSPLGSGLLFNNNHGVTFSATDLGTVDLSFLRDIDIFEELRLTGTDCSHLSQYVSGKQIDWLIVNHAELSDISWLETVTKTWKVELADNPGIKDLSVLKKMKNLQTVTVSEDMRPLTKALGNDISFSFEFV